jgi:hypothetical protein
LFGPVSIVIPPLFFYLSRIGNSFPKRVLIRKKPPTHRIKSRLNPTTSPAWLGKSQFQPAAETWLPYGRRGLGVP